MPILLRKVRARQLAQFRQAMTAAAVPYMNESARRRLDAELRQQEEANAPPTATHEEAYGPELAARMRAEADKGRRNRERLLREREIKHGGE